jgi:hypothetical protein
MSVKTAMFTIGGPNVVRTVAGRPKPNMKAVRSAMYVHR